MPELPAAFTLREIHVLDEGGGFTDPIDVVVRDGVIVAVEAGAERPQDGIDVDCAGLWLMPGVFDCHAGLDCFTEDLLELVDMDVTLWAMQAANNARILLDLGITSVRDLAGATTGVRDGIARGWVPGPHLFVSGTPIGRTGGSMDGFLPSTGQEAILDFLAPEYPGRPPYLADSPDEMRKAVRAHLRAGVDWIQLMMTGTLMASGHDHPAQPHLTDEELAAAIFEAHRAGVPVAVHAYGGPGLDSAIRAGARSIEHGTFLTEAQAAEMAKRGCSLVPTRIVFAELRELVEKGELDERSTKRVEEFLPSLDEQVAIARAAGVRIAVGTDLVRQGRNLEEIVLLAEAGLTPEEALLAATAAGAELCGDTERGRIEAGKVFDAILLNEDPSDLQVFRRSDAVTGVFQGGRPVKRHERVDTSLAQAVS